MVGSYLVVYALYQQKWKRVFIGVTGVAAVAYAGQATALLGVAMGAIVYILFEYRSKLLQLSFRVRSLIMAVGFFLLLSFAIAINPSLSGRWDIYREFLVLWRDNPLFGVGMTRISEVTSSVLHWPWIHDGHNFVVDSLAKYGILVTVLVVLLICTALVVTSRYASEKSALGLALVMTYLIMGVLESHGAWMYLGIPTVWLFLAVIVSDSRSRSCETEPNVADAAQIE
jgi:O-antigen ligase